LVKSQYLSGMYKDKIIRVSWVDSQIVSYTWTHFEDIVPKIATVESVGFVVSENKETLTLAASVSHKSDSDSQATQIITIPKCSIKSRKTIT